MSEPVCQPCADEGRRLDAAGFCVDCNESLCQHCYQGHCTPRPMRSHRLLDREEMLRVNAAINTPSVGATSPIRIDDQSIVNSSAEDTEDQLITQATHVRDVYVKPNKETIKLFGSIKSIAVFANGTVVVASEISRDVSYTDPGPMTIEFEHRDRYGPYKGSIFRDQEVGIDEKLRKRCTCTLVDTKTNKILSEIVLPGECSGMTKLSEHRLAMCAGEDVITVLTDGTMLVVEKRVYYSYSESVKRITSLDNIIYISIENKMQLVDMVGNVKQSRSTNRIYETAQGKQHYTIGHFVVYNHDGQTNMYAITHISPYIFHGDCTKELEPVNLQYQSKSGTSLPPPSYQGPAYICMGEDGHQLFLAYTYAIYVVRTGTLDARLLLDRDDGIQGVSCIAYNSHTQQLSVAMINNNFMRMYRLG